MSSTDSPIQPSSPASAPPRPPLAAQLRLAVEAAEDRKAAGIRVLDIAKVSDFSDRFLICSGTNERQVRAIADRILHRLREHGVRPLHVEGQRNGKWVLLDFGGDMVIHVFLDDTRSFYGLDRLWSDAPEITQQYATAAAEPHSDAATH